MKKIIIVLFIGLMFVAANASAAILECTMYASENDGTFALGGGHNSPPVTSDYDFWIETDASGNPVAWKNYLNGLF